MLREKKYILLVLGMFLIFLLLNCTSAYGEDGFEGKKILVLSSYDVENQWEVSVVEGFKSKLASENSIKFEYLDSKVSSSESYGDSFLNLLNLKYKSDGIDCILAIDDEAFNLIRLNLFNEDMFFYKKPIIFVGVNNYVSLSFEESKYMTGLMEYQDNSLMMEIIEKEHKKLEDVYILLDKSIYSQTIKKDIETILPMAEVPFNYHFIESSYFSEVLDRVSDINEKTSALYLCGTYMAEDSIMMPSKDVVRLIRETTKSPLYTKLDHYVESGAIGGIINDGRKLGATAAILLERFTEEFGEISITPLYNTYNTSLFNYKVMTEYNINPLKLPKNTTYINKGPFDLLLPRYLIILVWMTVAFIFIGVIFAIYSSYKSKKKAQYNRLLFIESEERNKIRTDFIITLSHELRTPLNIIINSGQLLIDRTERSEFNISFFIEKLKFIIRNSDRLLKYINNLIDASKLEIGYMNVKFNNSNIVYLLEDTTLAIVDTAEKHNLEVIFNTEEEEIITAIDEEKICRVLLILLSNAIKFSKESGSIYVDISRDEQNIVIKVMDNGIGISENIQQSIFEKFKRVQSVSSLTVDQEGSGLGLYIAKGFVQLHNGNINVESEVNKGSAFIVTLPIVIVEDNPNDSPFTEDELKRLVKLELSDI